ncbi:hypothetical protein AAVH_13249 [Aphelenchoides avenae]|nr:hypothetical protein AAVH_13249 [Aphelenchus avenae]
MDQDSERRTDAASHATKEKVSGFMFAGAENSQTDGLENGQIQPSAVAGEITLEPAMILCRISRSSLEAVLKTVDSVTITDRGTSPVCLIYFPGKCDMGKFPFINVAIPTVDAFAAELFEQNLLRPTSLAVGCMKSTVLASIGDIGKAEAFDLDHSDFCGLAPEPSTKILPKTRTLDERYRLVVKNHAHLINAERLCLGRGDELEKSVVSSSQPCLTVKQIEIDEDSRWRLGTWTPLLGNFRKAFPQWEALEVRMDVHPCDVGYDTYFRNTINTWSEEFGNYLRSEPHPLTIRLIASMELESKGTFRAADFPSFVMTRVTTILAHDATETTFNFKRAEEFGLKRMILIDATITRRIYNDEVPSDDEDA